MPSSATRSTHLPGTTERYAGRDAARSGACASCSHGLRRVAMEYSPQLRHPVHRACRRRHHRTRAADWASTWSRPATSSSASRRLGRRRASRRTNGRREALPHQGPRVRRRSASRLATGTPTTEYDIQQLMAGWFRDEGLVSDSPPNRRRRQENAGNPHYLPTAAVNRAIRPDEIVLLDLWGKLDRPGLCSPTSRGSATPARQVPERYAQVFDGGRRGATPPSALVSERGPRRPRASRLASRSRRVVGAAHRRVRRPHPAPDRPQPWRIRARQRRQHGRLRDPRRSAAAGRHRLYD